MARPQTPRSALMVDENGAILAVALPFVAEKVTLGWFLVATDDEILSEPLPPPAMDMQKLANTQSNPHRDHGYGIVRDHDTGDER